LNKRLCQVRKCLLFVRAADFTVGLEGWIIMILFCLWKFLTVYRSVTF